MGDEVQQIKDRLDIAEVISSYLTLKKAGANLKANCPFHHEKTPSFMVSPERQSFKCFGCFPAGQLIQTSEGFNEIQKIKKNDKVYSSKGILRRVNMTFEREYQGDLMEIIPRMIALPVKITGDHKILVIRTRNCKQAQRETRICQKNCRQNCPTKYFLDYKLEKIPARELEVNDFLLYPVKTYIAMRAYKIDLIKYAKIEKKQGMAPRELKEREIAIDNDFARLAGLYIAEGSSHRAYIRFSFGNHEEDMAQEIVRLIKTIFGLNSSIHRRTKGKTGIEVTCCHSLLAQAFEVIFGKGAVNKKIPEFFLNQSDRIKESLINAIQDGDGTVTKDQKKSIGGRKAIVTISQSLIHQLKDILISLGQRPSIYRKNAYTTSDNVNHKISYYVNWRENDKTHFSDFFEIKGIKYWVLPVKKILHKEFSGLVYNLNVEKDHSYLTQSFAVANCGEGGDIFTFIEKIEGVDFYNALKILADKAGIKLERKSIKYGDQEFKSDRKTRIFEINDWAKKLYHKILIDHPKAIHAREYLENRGLTEKTIKDFEIGYAPDSWDLLTKFLKSKEYSIEEIVQSGVAIRNDRGDCYDRFRGRIMFPINNIMGLTIAFTSRIIKDDPNQAKYINSSESPIYTKGKTIYGLDKAKMAIKEVDLAIFVEGNMDVIACHQAGFKNVVATSGTAITEDQIKILSRYASEIAFSFDTDTAGEAAMKKAIRLALQNDTNSKIIALQMPFKDPDEAIKSDPRNWKKAEESAKPALEYWINLLIRKNPDLSVAARKKIAKEILPVIKIIASDIEKEHYIKYLAKRLAVSEKALISVLEKTKMEMGDKTEKPFEHLKETKLDLSEKLVGMIWYDNSFVNLLGNELEDWEPSDSNLSSFAQMLSVKKIDREKLDPKAVELLNQFTMTVISDLGSEEGEIIEEEFKFLLGRIRSEKREHLKSEFARKIKEAEENGDKEEVKRLLGHFSSLIK